MTYNTEDIVFVALKDLLAELGSSVIVDNNTPLYGTHGCLNSLALVRLIVDIEEIFIRDYGKAISIANEKALSIKHSPFQTPSSLISYINSLLTTNE